MNRNLVIPFAISGVLFIAGCAKQSSSIDGGPVDTAPPVTVGAIPANFSTRFKGEKVDIYFDEYVQLRELNKNFSVSPPMEKKPDVVLYGKFIRVRFHSPLKEGFTYTLSFGKSIVDNNEANPLGFFEYVFSTGDVIDSLSLTGRVVNAFDLSPGDKKDQTQTFTKVMLYSTIRDSIPYQERPDYIAVADQEGFFRLSHVRPGTYFLFALRDVGDNFLFDIPSESIAFADSLVVLDQDYYHRPDSLFNLIHDDSVKIKTPELIPLDVEMFLFEEPRTRQYLLNVERTDWHKLVLSFNLPLDRQVLLNPVDQDEDPGVVKTQKDYGDWSIQRLSAQSDTLNVWIKDTSLIHRTPLIISVTYPATDSLRNTVMRTDTIPLTYQSKSQGTQSSSGARKRNGNQPAVKVLLPYQKLQVSVQSEQSLIDLHVPFALIMSQPVTSFDAKRISLSEMVDTIPKPIDFSLVKDTSQLNRFMVKWNIKEDTKYVMALDSMSFTSMYGAWNDTVKFEFRTQRSDYYSSIRVALSNVRNQVLVQVLDEKGEKVLKEVVAQRNGVVNLNFLPPSVFKLKIIQDMNRNGRWDTGLYLKKKQPERVEFYPELITTQSSFTSNVSWRLK